MSLCKSRQKWYIFTHVQLNNLDTHLDTPGNLDTLWVSKTSFGCPEDTQDTLCVNGWLQFHTVNYYIFNNTVNLRRGEIHIDNHYFYGTDSDLYNYY